MYMSIYVNTRLYQYKCKRRHIHTYTYIYIYIHLCLITKSCRRQDPTAKYIAPKRISSQKILCHQLAWRVRSAGVTPSFTMWPS